MPTSILDDLVRAVASLAKRVRLLEAREFPVVGTGTGGHIIQDEGVDVPNEGRLNFVGPYVTVTDNPGGAASVVTITASAGHVIQDEGTPLTTRPNLNFIGSGVTATDNAGTSATDVTIPGISGIGLENKVWLFQNGSTVIVVYNADATGLDAALTAAAGGGFTVQLPIGSISGDHTIPANVCLRGVDRKGSVLTGAITGANGASLENCTISRSANNGSPLYAVITPASGIFRVESIDIAVTQAGSGAARGVSCASGNCAITLTDCYIYVSSASGLGYAAYREAGIDASIYIYGGRCYGSTTPFNE